MIARSDLRTGEECYYFTLPSSFKQVAAQTPLDRVAACPDTDPVQIAALTRLRARLDPFVLAQRIEAQLEHIFRLATRSRRLQVSTSAQVLHPSPRPPSRTTTG